MKKFWKIVVLKLDHIMSSSIWWFAVLLISSILAIEYDENGNIIYNDYNREYEIDDDMYFEMSISQLLSWTLGSIFIGIILFGGGIIWYKQTQRLNNKM